MKFSARQTAAYGLGAVGKDMVYALSVTYVMFYYQDVLGLPAGFVGLILMIARIFDAANDPFMGILVAKTHTRMGRFRPWLLSGSVLNAFVLYFLFSAPDLSRGALMVWFSVLYILWGVTYTMMDIPYWSMIPAVTTRPEERERLSVVGRTCAGIGNALITVFTMQAVMALGQGQEREGFARVALIVAGLFVMAELVLVAAVRETRTEKMKTGTVREMFRALLSNDQALVTVAVIICINSALYLTLNLVIYFFKYDLGGADWVGSYTVFNMVGGLCQILGMMLVYPLLRRRWSNPDVFKLCIISAVTGYALILVQCVLGLASLPLLCICGALVFLAIGILAVLTTVFLSGAVDYGELKTGRREESVIFSMQTFVVKAASGLAVFVAGLGLELIGLHGTSEQTLQGVEAQSAGTLMGLRVLMTLLPIAGLILALAIFRRRFTLTDERVRDIADQLAKGRKQG